MPEKLIGQSDFPAANAIQLKIAVVALMATLFCSTATALSIVGDDDDGDGVIEPRVWFFLDNQRDQQPISGIFQGQTITIGAQVDDIGQFDSGTATHTPSGTSFGLIDIEPIFGVPYVSVDVQNDSTKRVGADWVVQVDDGSGGSDSASPNRDLTNVEFMPMPEQLSGSGSLDNYTLSWQLPTTGPTINAVQVQLFDKAANEAKFVRYFSANTTTISGDLTQFFGDGFTGEIAARVLAVNHEPINDQVRPNRTTPFLWEVVTRSSNWIEINKTEATASGNVASLTAGSPASISQVIDTPALPFTVSFDFLFTTLTGELVVLLDGVQLGSPLTAPDALGMDFLTATFDVDDPLLLGKDDLLLTFLLDGVTGSQVLIDNISAPGILNGNFAAGLTAWQAGGPGTVELTSVPVPSAVMLMALGVVSLRLVKRKRLAA